MRGKILGFLLIASLALNLFFVAGVIRPDLAVWPRLMGPPHPPHGRDPVAAAADDFALDDGQVAALEALRQRIAERRNESRGERDGFQAIILDALRQPAFDRAAFAKAMDERRESFGGSFLDMMEDLHGFVAGLTADQKAAFLERVREDRDFLRRLLFPPRPRGDRQPR